MDDIYKGKTSKEIIELVYDLTLQNTNGRETELEMYKLGIEACYEELCEGEIDNKEQQINNEALLETVPYQCCPVCNGTGQVLADGFTSAVYQPCKVCNGAMIIPMYIVEKVLKDE